MATNHPRLVLITQAVQAGAKGGREGGLARWPRLVALTSRGHCLGLCSCLLPCSPPRRSSSGAMNSNYGTLGRCQAKGVFVSKEDA